MVKIYKINEIFGGQPSTMTHHLTQHELTFYFLNLTERTYVANIDILRDQSETFFL
jgi:hypothetical protein